MKLLPQQVCIQRSEIVIVGWREVWRMRSERDNLDAQLHQFFPGDFRRVRPNVIHRRTPPPLLSPLPASSFATFQTKGLNRSSRTFGMRSQGGPYQPLQNAVVDQIFAALSSFNLAFLWRSFGVTKRSSNGSFSSRTRMFEQMLKGVRRRSSAKSQSINC